MSIRVERQRVCGRQILSRIFILYMRRLEADGKREGFVRGRAAQKIVCLVTHDVGQVRPGLALRFAISLSWKAVPHIEALRGNLFANAELPNKTSVVTGLAHHREVGALQLLRRKHFVEIVDAVGCGYTTPA